MNDDYIDELADGFLLFGDNSPGGIVIFIIILIIFCIYEYTKN
jgi:hypothetical protein